MASNYVAYLLRLVSYTETLSISHRAEQRVNGRLRWGGTGGTSSWLHIGVTCRCYLMGQHTARHVVHGGLRPIPLHPRRGTVGEQPGGHAIVSRSCVVTAATY